MSRQEVANALKANKYIILTSVGLQRVGVNGNILKTKKVKEQMQNPEVKTIFIGYRPCSINEYISKKIEY